MFSCQAGTSTIHTTMQWYFLVLFGLISLSAADDTPCKNIGGTCQYDSNKCPGSYYTGKCSGNVYRRCCTKRATVRYTGGCSNVRIVSRDSWGARRTRSSSTIRTPVPDFFIHHTAGGACKTFLTCVSKMKGIQNYHMDHNRWADIGYSFLVGEDGRLYEGRGWDRVGAHTRNYNSKSLAVAFMGTFTYRRPSTAALNAGKALIRCGISKRKISSSYALFGHRDVGSTSCPGTTFYNLIKTWPRFHAHYP